MAVVQVHNIAGVYGLDPQADWVVEEAISAEASTTIAAGDGVAATTTFGRVLQVTTAAGQGLQLIGIAAAAILAGKQGLIITKGMVNTAKADHATNTVGQLLTAPGTTAGRLNALTLNSTTQGQAIGVITKAGATAAGSVISGVYLQKM